MKVGDYGIVGSRVSVTVCTFKWTNGKSRLRNNPTSFTLHPWEEDINVRKSKMAVKRGKAVA